MDDPVAWGSARIFWDAEVGYELRLPHSADALALSLRHDRLVKAIRAALPGRERVVEFFTPTKMLDKRTTESGRISIQTDSMITDSEAHAIREEVGAALRGAVAEAEEVAARDAAAADSVLAVLRLEP
jgi:hypothetical protein